MFYEFKEEDARQFANHMNVRTRVKGNELVFSSCPICHAKDKDTFSINLKSGQCQCMRSSCSYKGNMITLARDIEGFELDKSVSAYYNINGYNNRFRTFKNYKPKVELKALEYMKSRGISESITRKYEITMKKGESDVLVFPFKDENNNLTFIKYRNTKYIKGESFGSKEWCEKECKPILFGMAQCELDTRELIITEGQIDSLSVAEAGIKNALSVPTGKNGFTWVPHCWNFLQQFETFIIFGDREDGSMTLLEDFKRLFYKKHIKHVRLEDYKDCKDANEILQKYGKKQIKECIKNAIDIPIAGLVDLSDIKPLNRYEIPKLPTGFKDLDRCLCGGFPFGSVIDITGKTGEGKSTIASWIIAQALELNHKCFVYSGEMDKALFKEGLDRQICGKDVQEIRTADYTNYYISEDDQRAINEWYRGKCFFYDVYSMAIDEAESEYSTLTNKIEECYTHYGIDVFLLDNLMTAMDQENISGADKYEQQSKFMKRLVSMAVRYQILIILVAHNRKNSSDNQNDNISGTADIGNLAAVTLDYTKAYVTKDKKGNVIHPEDTNGQEIRNGQRVMRLGKNRFFSTICPEGWATEYDIKSNRVWIRLDTRDKVFNYKEAKFEQMNIEEIPF